ncbi:hypothetical protein FH972_019874 [Carpinus fangiana]|uniref:Uncharacterized protein n=1 Tax=Carpinus fangiana TaxID=176857 RepID=A0A5N6RT10_9ROSI|nr:hypothetical protein FH972_019874 [Carpinus fangiana]
MAVEPTCLVGLSATRLCYARASWWGCLGYGFASMGLNPLRFPCFGWPHGGRAYMLGGFIVDTSVHVDGVNFTQCYARASWWGCLGYGFASMGLNPLRFPCFGWPHRGRAYMLGGFVGDTPVLRTGKLVGLLGLLLCFHGVEPPSVSLLWLALWQSSLRAWWFRRRHACAMHGQAGGAA